jgi:selenocysteine lyase/cysteine desulfurase
VDDAALEHSLGRIDIDRVRADTPAADRRIHVNNAGASLPPAIVTRATVEYLETESSEGGYETAAARADDLDRVYREAAIMLGCDERELAFQQNATQAWWAAFNSVALRPGDRVLATTAEYVASGIALVLAAEQGIDVELIPDDEHGQTSVDALAAMLDDRVKLVCATHVPTSGGLINPVAAIGDVIRANSDARYLVDACQSAGQLPLDVAEIGADFLSFTGRKFCRAPRGTGMLYQRAGLEGLVPPRVNDGQGTDWVAPWQIEPKAGARVHELFEYSFAAKVGFGVALGYANELGLDNIAARTGALAARLRRQLATIEGVEVADRGVARSGIVTFAIDGVSPARTVRLLTDRGINTSTTRRSSGQFDLAERAPDGLVRASVHYFNTVDELDRIGDAVTDIARRPARLDTPSESQ